MITTKQTVQHITSDGKSFLDFEEARLRELELLLRKRETDQLIEELLVKEAKSFIAILSAVEGKPVKCKGGRPVGSRNKPKVVPSGVAA